MSRLKGLTDYKNAIIKRLIGNQDVLKAAYYQDKKFLSKPDVKPKEILFNNIYPFDFIPSTAEELKIEKTYITMSVTDYRKVKGDLFRAGNIFINVLTHKNLFQTDYDVLRVDYLVDAIDEMMSGKRGIGLGELEFIGYKEYRINSEYLGGVLQYRPVDFS